MANYSAKIFGSATSALQAQQGIIAVTSNNIANANTPGYTRRVAQLQTRTADGASTTGVSIGNGVELKDVTRVSDEYIERLLRDATSTQSQQSIRQDYLSKVDALFSLSGDQTTIGSAFTNFFSALNDLALNPSSIELRSNVLQKGQELTTSINQTYNSIAGIQTELDTRLSTEIQTVNSLTAQIAELNTRVTRKESTGTTASDERDQRDVLLNKLAEKISFDVVETSSGDINITLSNGFTLVNSGTSRSIETTNSPSFGSSPMPQSLGGGVLSHVVYDYDSSGTDAHVDLTQVLQSGTGTIGGLLQMRGYAAPTNTSPFQADGELVAVATRVEAIARQLLLSFNNVYQGPDESPTASPAVSQGSAGDLNGSQAGAFGLFNVGYSGVLDANADGDADQSDLNATGYGNFASRIRMAITDPRGFAAARDLNATENATTFAPGDAQNVTALLALRTSSQTFSLSSYSFTGTYNDAYTESVTYVGQVASAAELGEKVASDNFITVSNQRDSISAVSIDEEFANMIKFQKAFQASAKMIGVARDLLDEIVRLI